MAISFAEAVLVFGIVVESVKMVLLQKGLPGSIGSWNPVHTLHMLHDARCYAVLTSLALGNMIDATRC